MGTAQTLPRKSRAMRPSSLPPPMPAHVQLRWYPVHPFEHAREAKRICKRELLCDLLHRQAPIAEQLSSPLHLEPRNELVSASASESPEQARQVHPVDVARDCNLLNGAERQVVLFDVPARAQI